MKKNFNTPEMNITLFAVENIVTESAVAKAEAALGTQADTAAATTGKNISQFTLIF